MMHARPGLRQSDRTNRRFPGGVQRVERASRGCFQRRDEPPPFRHFTPVILTHGGSTGGMAGHLVGGYFGSAEVMRYWVAPGSRSLTGWRHTIG